jgi:hypothetical protein
MKWFTMETGMDMEIRMGTEIVTRMAAKMGTIRKMNMDTRLQMEALPSAEDRATTTLGKETLAATCRGSAAAAAP